MPTYQYQAKDQKGKNVKGVLSADSERQIREQLLAKQLIPISIKTIKINSGDSWLHRLRNKIRTKTLVSITRQLSTLITAGVPLDEALSAIIEQEEKQHVRSIMLGVRTKVMEGHSLSVALSFYPHTFSPIYCSTIAAGEKAGKLAKVLIELASHTNKQQRLKQQIQQALLYPMVMLVVSFSVVIYLMSAVVPKILQVVQQAHQTLPWQTKLLLVISHTITHDGYWILAALILVIIGLHYVFKKTSVRTWWQKFLLKIPLFGKLILSLNIARFARTLSIATSAGVPILDALRNANDAITLLPIKNKVNTAINEVREGTSLHHALRRSQSFPPTFVYLIASGEASGQLDKALGQAADDEQFQLESWIKSALILFEPIMILIMGSVVLFIVLAILVPIFNLDQIAGG